MRYELFQEVALAQDIPVDGLRKGDLATVVEHHPVPGSEDGYSLEVFNAFGATVVVTVVPESAIEALPADHVLSVRPLDKAAAGDAGHLYSEPS
jgi:hypothetical protein